MARGSAQSPLPGVGGNAWYNDSDPFAAAWLRNLVAAGHISAGHVDERSIGDVAAADLGGYGHCHFFAGIGGWAYALALAGWPSDRPVWTGSCPCQAFSGAARGRTTAPDLWPAWLRLIAANRPGTIFGEQVAQKGSWLDRVCDDLGALGYEVGAAILPAVAVGADHARSRIYFVGNAHGQGKPVRSLHGKVARLRRHGSIAGSMVPANGLSARMASLRTLGNAIVPQVAAEFIRSVMEAAW